MAFKVCDNFFAFTSADIQSSTNSLKLKCVVNKWFCDQVP